MTPSRLRDLFSKRFSASPAEQQRLLVESFRDTLQQTNLVSWRPGDTIPSGVFLLVGVMVGWNAYDQELASSLDEAVSDSRTNDDIVALFAADEFSSPEEVETVFPGLRSASQSPYVGVWEDTGLRLVDAGASAMAFLADRYGLKLP